MSNQLRLELEPSYHLPKTSLQLSWNAQGMLTAINWIPPGTEPDPAGVLTWAPAPILEFATRLKEYFRSGTPLGTLPWECLDQSAWTQFQYQVFSCIMRIPHGETRTYGWVASRIGRPRATRAVGQALRSNPLPVFVPCHRVVASGGSLGGFMGASDPNDPEMTLKRGLLEIETSYLNPSFSFLSGPFVTN